MSKTWLEQGACGTYHDWGLNVWKHISFKDGSNPYICKTEEDFARMNKKYKLTRLHGDCYQAEEK